MLTRRVLCFLSALLGAANLAHAERYEFRLEHDGTPVSGGRVCFYKALGDTDFFEKFAASNDVRCVPADKLLTIPPGRWRYFAEADGLVSGHPNYYTLTGHLSPTAVHQVGIPLLPAAYLDPRTARAALAPSESLAIYISNEGTDSPASMRPITATEQRLAVPANMHLIPMVIRDGAPFRIGDPFMLDENEALVLAPIVPVPGRSDVVVYVGAPDPWHSNLERVTKAPEIVLLRGKGETIAPVLPVRSAAGFERTLQIFKSVPPGDAQVQLRGALWKRDELSVTVPTGSRVVVAPRKLLAVPAAAITVNWSYDNLPQDLPDEPPCNPAAHERRAPAGGFDTIAPNTARAIGCIAPKPDAKPVCEVKATVPLPGPTGEVTFPSLASGDYAVEVRYRDFPPMSGEARLTDAREEQVTLRTTAVVVQGRVLRDDAPVKAQLQFRSEGTVSLPSTGQYAAVLTAGKPITTITVIPCDTMRVYREVLSEPLTQSALHDIQIPSNSVEVFVTDEAEKRPIADATVTFGIMASEKDEAALYTDGVRLKNESPALIGPFAPAQFVTICASARDYADTCIAPFRLKSDEKKTVRIALSRVAAHLAKLVVGTPLLKARAFWVDGNGRVTEESPIAADGAFSYRLEHVASDYVVIVSGNLPLTIVPVASSIVENDIKTFAMPVGVTRTFAVRYSPTGGGRTPFTIAIGNLLVPHAVFVAYQFLQGQPSRVSATEPTVAVAPILETAPLIVILAPDPWPVDVPPDVDIFARPEQLVHMRRLPVSGPVVEFP